MNQPWKTLLSRLHSFGTRNQLRPLEKRRTRRSSLAVEQLEDRCVPAFLMRVSNDGGSTWSATITDGGPGDLNPLPNNISANIGAFTLTSTANNFISQPITLMSLQINGTSDVGNYDLVVQATIDGINTAPAPQTLSYDFTGSILPGGTGGVSMQTWVDNTNTLFGTTGSGIVANTGSQTVPSLGNQVFTGNVPYSATTQIRANFTGGPSSLSLNNVNSITPSAVTPATIGNFIWHDLNANGIQESGEPGVPGATVELFTSTNTLVGTQVTAADGLYLFTNLAPGDYYVKVTPPSGYTFSPQDQGLNDAVDSDANTTTGVMATTTLIAGEDDRTWDAGLYQTVQVGDFVWHDLNANGIQDAGEPGINGVTLTLTGTTGFGAPVTQTTTTTGNGGYLFDNLPPGTYTVTVDASNFTGTGALVGYMASPTGQGGNTALDSNPSPTGTTPSALPGGSSDLTLDFGFFQKVQVGDLVWHDLNANGIQDAGEPGINGVTLTLTGTTGFGAPVTQTTTTAGNGGYLFDNLPPGIYAVTVDASNFISGGALEDYMASPTGQGGNPALDSNPSPTGTTPSALPGGSSDLTLDFGYFQKAAIGDFLWHDLDRDGVQDAGEPGLPGVTVRLIQNNAVVGTTTTDANGLYLFDNLTPGDYCVQVVPPTGYSVSPQDQGGDDAKDSDANPSTGKMALTTLTSGETDLTWDAGLFTPPPPEEGVAADIPRPGSLSGRVCLLSARGHNGTHRPGRGIPGVTLILTGTNAAGQRFTRVTKTNRDGFYVFSGLPAGFTYEIREIQPRGYRNGPSEIGTQGGKAGKDRLFDIFLRSGVNGTGNDFCEVLRPSKKAFLASGRFP